MIYLAIDGDNVGQVFERLVLEEKPGELASYCQSVTARLELLKDTVLAANGEIIIMGGDTLIARFDGEPPASLFSMVGQAAPVTFCCGVGETLREAWTALRYAKTRKPGAAIRFNGAFTSCHLPGGESEPVM